ncbi:MAG: AraC family transcriptional regulator [Marinomonas sp.]
MTIKDTFHYQHLDAFPGFTIGEASSAQFSFQPHFHLDYHIGLVTQGTLHQTWEGQKHHLKLGDICIMPPDVVHNGNEQGEETYHLTTFRISPDRLNTFFFDSQYHDIYQQLAPNVIHHPELVSNLLQLKASLQSEQADLQKDSLLISSLAELLYLADKKSELEEDYLIGKQAFIKIRDYCESNLHNKITLDELANLTSLTRFQFIRRFQKQIGLAPHAWLMRLRLERACISLAHSKAMIADIATANGFYDQSHFNRMFKMAYQISPSQYRLHTA